MSTVQAQIMLKELLDALQDRVIAWGSRCFGKDHMTDAKIRGERLVEEAIEYAQSVGIPEAKINAIAYYVYEREPGDPQQELGGVANTLMAAAGSQGVSLHDVTIREIERCESKSPEHFRKRNQAKIDAGFDGK